MTSRIRLVGLSTATAKQQHRPRSTKLGAPSLWELSIDPVDTPEGREPLRGGLGGQGNQEREYSYYWRKTPNGLGAKTGDVCLSWKYTYGSAIMIIL